MIKRMNSSYIDTYLHNCKYNKNLNEKTIRAYACDLKQFYSIANKRKIDKTLINDYILYLNQQYEKPKTIKRKIASIKAFLYFLESNDYITINPFSKMNFQYKEPILLPKTIQMHIIQQLLELSYENIKTSKTEYEYKTALRDTTVLELLFSTGIRVSELCNLSNDNMLLEQHTIKIYGKGSKERILQIGNDCVKQILSVYYEEFHEQILLTNHFFINKLGTRLSEHSVRIMINRLTNQLQLSQHITPHMFRHTFATQLLENDVDIRYIQRILGHSSINTTQIYTHVSSNKQKEILITKNPRNGVIIKQTP